jgi:hypothetical protein
MFSGCQMDCRSYRSWSQIICLGLEFFDEFNVCLGAGRFTPAMEMMNAETLDDEYIQCVSGKVKPYKDGYEIEILGLKIYSNVE